MSEETIIADILKLSCEDKCRIINNILQQDNQLQTCIKINFISPGTTTTTSSTTILTIPMGNNNKHITKTSSTPQRPKTTSTVSTPTSCGTNEPSTWRRSRRLSGKPPSPIKALPSTHKRRSSKAMQWSPTSNTQTNIKHNKTPLNLQVLDTSVLHSFKTM